MENKIIFATRAEELGNRVFDYFAMPPQSFYSRLLKNKAAVLVGGRGTGKTMLLKSMALEYKIINKNQEESVNLWDIENHIGCYIRIDTNVVSSFRGRGIEDETWGHLFAHYFNLRISQQITKTLNIIKNKSLIQKDSLNEFINRYAEIVDFDGEASDLNFVEKDIRRKLDELIKYINNPRKVKEPILTNNGDIFFELCNILAENSQFTGKTWFILLDEFENLSENQQRIVNTLIKINQPPVIFKLAMRPGGWWTQQTLSLTESLEQIADFDLIDYQTDFKHEDYSQLIIEAFNKSLSLNQVRNPDFLDVRNLLPNLGAEDEALLLLNKSKRKPEYVERIIAHVNNFTSDTNKQKMLLEKLILEDKPLESRFHLVLLERKMTPENIVFLREKQNKKFIELYRHNRIGTLYLLCSDYKARKIYAGFETYVLLSSKIMRNFVALFSRAWELSVDEGFSPLEPKAFDYLTQSRAAHDVSRDKVFEVKSYPSIGSSLSSFTNQLGRVFEQLNKDERQSQPERNHFAILGDVSNEAKGILRGALMYSVLQEIPATKLRKDTEIRGSDYLLNRIYAPYYNISIRKMHKLELQSSEFENLILGSDHDKKDISVKLLRKYLKNEAVSTNVVETKQMDLFDTFLQGDRNGY
ncbi:hypothetical protein [Paenibacillus qinlingensis]|uniref:ORC-CDC6 family AAA ATPase n=1 Tax=Paenibacillus qinlingensis TaxID=1837343 RepID=UPI00156569B7|nr:hypothetical protein [Paenibacillus qinlingensis]NQX63549.1 hypothetical protein [Paenibacillus qinlingensis]